MLMRREIAAENGPEDYPDSTAQSTPKAESQTMNEPARSVFEWNRRAWNAQVAESNEWTVPVSPAQVAEARAGNVRILLTPTKHVPADWFPDLAGCRILCLASGGGQQGPLLAAAGAEVTVYDASPDQLRQDDDTAVREGLCLQTVEGDMADLSAFHDQAFDLIVHPCSNVFAVDVRPVWREAIRVLRHGGHLLAGFCNPLRFLFDIEALDRGEMIVRHRIPYSDLEHLSDDERQRMIIEKNEPLEFGHTLDDQIGGQLDAGFELTGFFEDRWREGVKDPVSDRIASFISTRARRP